MNAKVDCPRGCGWNTGNPDLDENGMPYACFFCENTGLVDEAAALEDLAAQAETLAWKAEHEKFERWRRQAMAAAGEFGGDEDNIRL